MKGFAPENFDIMGRKQCSSIMPCKICRTWKEYMQTLPKGYGLKIFEWDKK